MINEKDALMIAKSDAEKVYRDLTVYEIKSVLRGDKWYVDYDLNDPNVQGGGPHYVISCLTGKIEKKVYEQ